MATMTYGNYVNNKGGDKNGVYRLQEDGTMIYIPNTGNKGSAGTGSTLNLSTGTVAGGAAGYSGAVETYTPPAADSTPTGTVKADTPVLDIPVVEPPTTEQPTGNYYTNILAGLDDQYQKALARAEDIRKQYEGIAQTERDRLYKNAELAKDKAVVDASTARKKASATYGNNAEALRRMGLTGSGYGEYLEGKAYALERGDVQAANAAELLAKRQADEGYLDTITQGTAAASQLVTEAENAYTSGKLQLESQLKEDGDKTASNYLKLMDSAKTGNYTADEIRAAAAVLGITDESQISAIVNAATTANTKKTEKEEKEDNAAFDEVLATANGSLTREDIENTDFTTDQKKQLTEANDNAILSYIATAVQGAGAQNTFAEIDELKDKEQLSDDGYHNANFLVFLDIIEGESDLAGQLAAIEAQVDKYAREGKITEADAKALKQYAASKGVVSVDVNNVKLTKRDDIAGLFWLSIPGDEHANKCGVRTNSDIGKNELAILQKIEPQVGQLAKIGDKYYAYVSAYAGAAPQWYHFEQGGKKETFDALFDNLASRFYTVTRPKHAKDEDKDEE